MILVLIIIAIVIGLIIFMNCKVIRCGSATLITGGIKTGKSWLAVFLAERAHKKAHFLWALRTKIFRKHDEEPFLYSNIPLRYKYYVPLTKSIIERNERPHYKSILYFCEVSLIADSQYCKDPVFNEQALLWCKLFAHETRGGQTFIDTQSIADCHYAWKRTLSSYIYIHHTTKLPFYSIMHVQELRYSEDGMVQTNEDVEDSMKWFLIPNRIWHDYDRYAYSALTDELNVVNNVTDNRKAKDLKAYDIVSFKVFKTIKRKEEK